MDMGPESVYQYAKKMIVIDSQQYLAGFDLPSIVKIKQKWKRQEPFLFWQKLPFT